MYDNDQQIDLAKAEQRARAIRSAYVRKFFSDLFADKKPTAPVDAGISTGHVAA